MILYTYWRSSAAHRVRIALRLKGLTPEERYINVMETGPHRQSYLAVNPQGSVPSLDDDGVLMNQSLAIIEYLDECYPDPPLMPPDAPERARGRAISLNIACEIHPVVTPRTVNALGTMFDVSPERRTAWSEHWTHYGLKAVETRLEHPPATGRFCHGDTPTVADLCAVPQLQLAQTLGFDLSGYPTMLRIEKNAWSSRPFSYRHLRNNQISRAQPRQSPRQRKKCPTLSHPAAIGTNLAASSSRRSISSRPSACSWKLIRSTPASRNRLISSSLSK
jgi:maleylacetoacetate isomerase